MSIWKDQKKTSWVTHVWTQLVAGRGRTLGTVALVVWWPLTLACIVAALPLFSVYYSVLNTINFCRAARWSPGRAFRLASAVVGHLVFMVVHAPLMGSVLWYYVVKAPKDHVKKGIAYAPSIRRRPHKPAASSAASTEDGAQSSPPPSPPRSPDWSATRRSRRVDQHADGEDGTLEVVGDMRLDVYYHSRRAANHGSPTTSNNGSEAQSSANDSMTSLTDLDAPLSGSKALGDDSFTRPRTTGGRRRRPVVIFVYGGAWGSGNRWFYARMAARLREATGAVVVVPDYDPYPGNGIAGMVIAVHRVLQWTAENIERFGGDPRSITLSGHSAGAHLVMLYLTYRAMAVADVPMDDLNLEAQSYGTGYREPIPLLKCWPQWSFNYPLPAYSDPKEAIAAIRAVVPGLLASVSSAVLLSGCFDVEKHVLTTETDRAVELISPASGAPCGHFAACSPTAVLAALDEAGLLRRVAEHLPRDIALYHPEHDAVVRVEQSKGLAQMLNRAAELRAGETCRRSPVTPASAEVDKLLTGVMSPRQVGQHDQANPSFGPERYDVHLIPIASHSDVVIGPMLQDRPLHPTLVAIARSVQHPQPSQ